MPVTRDQVLDALRAVQDPDLHRDIVSLLFVKKVDIVDGKVSVVIELTTPACPVKDLMKKQAEDAIQALPGVKGVTIDMTAQVREAHRQMEDRLVGVKQCIAVASGKGGVGKSTVSVNLAIALAQTGAKVGLLDADVYGPSIPLMMGCEGVHPEAQGGEIVPIERFGIKMMSLGFILHPGQAVIWRGPMVAGTVKQLITDVAWGELDYLLFDLPPGTGDAPMSVAQEVPLAGVVIVATPQHVAASIATKSIELFKKLDAPIVGIVENMSGYVCPNCGTVSQVFTGASGSELAKAHHVPFLGSVPLDPAISEASDEGVPSIIAQPDHPQGQAFRDIAGRLAQEIAIAAEKSHKVSQPKFE